MMTPSTWGARRSMMRSRIGRPPRSRSPLSPPPMRRASPPASTTPRIFCISGSSASRRLVVAAALALQLRGFLGNLARIGIEAQALGAGQRHEALDLGAADQRHADLAGQLHAPGG